MTVLRKIITNYRQFGAIALGRQAGSKILRLFRERNVFEIYAVKSPGGEMPPEVAEVTSQSLAIWAITPDERESFQLFLTHGCRGFAVIEQDRPAGSAWIQERGEYEFGKVGRMMIPDNCIIFKNLFVDPDFRGCGIAGKLDRARLAATEGKLGVTFIIPENRYAIRNWQKLGMVRIGRVVLQRFFRGKWKLQTAFTQDDFSKSFHLEQG